ncbi:predicted protein [Nematostella vectensis]|uniref:AFG1-like ATPase n=1 Tax=Nematostella vectensis TaxID=45351 RepID=A7SWA6_NEMVE|nr:AFG1-like ATPase [Nematostella vectensis]EDO32020.1 predicted protein [Nematostella vectensis]|eukprot:XP_001624120.1 predicted protein [Nematostella vectensis]
MLRLCQQAIVVSPKRYPSLMAYRALGSAGQISPGPVGLYRSYLDQKLLVPDEYQRRAVNELQGLYHRIVEYGTATQNTSKGDPPPVVPKGLYLYGGVGSGKTILMDMFYDTVPIKSKRRVHFYSFMLQLYSEINRWNLCFPEDESTFDVTPIQDIASRLINDNKLLCFDEMQVTDYGSVRLLEGIFCSMFDQGVIVVATSNRSPSDLGASSFGRETEAEETASSLTRLLVRYCDKFEMNSGMDYRTVQRPGKKTYYHPINSDTDAILNSAFCDVVGAGTKLTRTSLQVYGRNVVVPVASQNGVARFSFDELCRSPLGPADYITICNNYHTVFLENIPQMNIYQKNEARRLLSFIDAVYESRVKLYCTAASAPEDLFQLIPRNSQEDPDKMHLEMIGELAYDLQLSKLDLASLGILTGEEEIFSFKRCISRLNEMQSEIYQQSKHRAQSFSPYIGTSTEQVESEGRRRVRENKRQTRLLEKQANDQQDEMPLTPLTQSTDWGDEASYLAWSNDIMRKELRDRELAEQVKREQVIKRRQPKFGEQHFWGFGWWEKIMGRERKNRPRP